MLICPDCNDEVKCYSLCKSCGWKITQIQGINSYLKTKKSSFLSDYIKNYQVISKDDLSETILPKSYLASQASKLLDYVQLDTSMKICDVGGGQGFFSNAAKKRGYNDLTVVDIAIPYLERLSKDFNCFVADAENLPFKHHFDAIFSTDVMEHVINVGSYLYCINRALVNKGKFIVRVPFDESLMSYSPHLGCDYDYVHLRSFNQELLISTLASAGFKVKSIHYDGFWTYNYKKIVKKIRVIDFLYSRSYPKLSSADFIDNNSLIKNVFCKLFIKPAEIVCVAEKVEEV